MQPPPHINSHVGANSHSPRILILSGLRRRGHLSAAAAVEMAMRHLMPHAFIRNVDVLTFAIRPFRYCYAQV